MSDHHPSGGLHDGQPVLYGYTFGQACILNRASSLFYSGIDTRLLNAFRNGHQDIPA